MNDIALPVPVPSPLRWVLRALGWLMHGVIAALLMGLLVIALLACGCSTDFALGFAFGSLDRDRPARGDRAEDDTHDERAYHLGRTWRRRLGLDALARRRAARRLEQAERRDATRARLTQRRHNIALRRAEVARRLRYKLRQTFLWLFAGIGVLATGAVLVSALMR